MKRYLTAFLILTLALVAGIRSVQFSQTDTAPITVRCSSRIPTLVRFPSRIYRVYLGAPSSWIVKVVNNDLVLRPKDKVETGIIVELLSGEIIPLRATIVTKKALADDLLLISLTEGVIVQQPVQSEKPPEKENRESADNENKEEPEPPAKKEQKSFIENVSEYNFAYKWKNSKRIKIKAVFDDGISTYIVYEKGSAVGAIYLKKGRKKEVINFVIKDNISRIDRTLLEGERFVVVYGKDRVEIKRN